ncbi:MAG TPA: 4Fe-4S ferredoxin, partial [Terriglobia bacterium]|nr:4Fe-4S ferredoxin [Terriglobia bacterium]
GIEFEPKNPVTHMMTDRKTGKLREDILNEKILSAIVEFKTPIENVPAVLACVDDVSRTLETVVSVGVSTRCDESGSSALDHVLAEEGFSVVRGKTNLGLGHA